MNNTTPQGHADTVSTVSNMFDMFNIEATGANYTNALRMQLFTKRNQIL